MFLLAPSRQDELFKPAGETKLIVVDMPGRLIDLFIRLCLQKKGTLSKRKRKEYFGMLRDEEVMAMEDAIRDGYRSEPT